MTQHDSTPAREHGLFTRDFAFIAVVNFALFTGFQMANVGIPVYIAQMGGSELQVGLSTTLFTAAALLSRPFVGLLVDRFGRKGFLVGGIALMVCSTAAYAVFPVVGVVLGLRMLHGLGWGFGSTASSTTAADIIPKKRFAEGMGYFGMTVSLAGAFAPALAVSLVQGPGAKVMVAAATFALVVALALAVFLRPTMQRQTEAKPMRELGISDFLERKALFPAGIMFLVNMGFGSINTFIVLHGEASGVSNLSLYFVTFALVNIVTRPYMGRLIDRFGYMVPGVAATVCMAASLVMLGSANSLATFCLSGAFVGLGGGTAMSTFQAMSVAAAPPERRGVATSTYMFLFDAGMGVGGTVAGLLAGALGYAGMYRALAVFPLLGCLAFALMGKKRLEQYRR